MAPPLRGLPVAWAQEWTMTTDKEGERPKHSQHIGLAFLELERQTRTRGGADGVFGQVMTEMTQRVRKRTWIDQVLSKLKKGTPKLGAKDLAMTREQMPVGADESPALLLDMATEIVLQHLRGAKPNKEAFEKALTSTFTDEFCKLTLATPRRAELRTLRQTLAKKPKKGSFADLVRQQLQKFPRADCRQMLLANMGALKAQQPQPVLQTLEEDVLRYGTEDALLQGMKRTARAAAETTVSTRRSTRQTRTVAEEGRRRTPPPKKRRGAAAAATSPTKSTERPIVAAAADAAAAAATTSPTKSTERPITAAADAAAAAAATTRDIVPAPARIAVTSPYVTQLRKRTASSQLSSLGTKERRLVFDLLNKKRGMEMDPPEVRECSRSSNSEYLYKKLVLPVEHGGLFVSDKELAEAVLHVVTQLPATSPAELAPDTQQQSASPDGMQLASPNKGGRPLSIAHAPVTTPSYTMNQLVNMPTKLMKEHFETIFGVKTGSGNREWLRKRLANALDPTYVAAQPTVAPRPTPRGQPIPSLPRAAAHRTPPKVAKADGDNGDVNEDHCHACDEGGGRLICCSFCVRSFHFDCLGITVEPPRDVKWACPRKVCKTMKDEEVTRGKQPVPPTVVASGSGVRKPQKSGRLPGVEEQQPRTSTRDSRDTAAKEPPADAGSQDSMDIFQASPTGAKAPATGVCLACQALVVTAEPRASAEETERAACFLCRMPLPLCESHRKSYMTKKLCSGCFAKGPNAADEDTHDDWCAHCQDGGDLVCCDTCSNTFHLACLEENWPDNVPKDEDELWNCPECCGVAKRPPRTAGNQSAAAAAHTKEKDDVAHAIEQVKAQRATSSKRKRWTADEEEALRNGIKRFKAGKWKEIYAEYIHVFTGRTPVDLKDKWRTLNKVPK